MKKAELEGIYDENAGYKIVKWKPSNHFQPTSNRNCLKADEMIQNKTGLMRPAFAVSKELITHRANPITLTDLIDEAVIHSQIRFDNIEMFTFSDRQHLFR